MPPTWPTWQELARLLSDEVDDSDKEGKPEAQGWDARPTGAGAIAIAAKMVATATVVATSADAGELAAAAAFGGLGDPEAEDEPTVGLVAISPILPDPLAAFGGLGGAADEDEAMWALVGVDPANLGEISTREGDLGDLSEILARETNLANVGDISMQLSADEAMATDGLNIDDDEEDLPSLRLPDWDDDLVMDSSGVDEGYDLVDGAHPPAPWRPVCQPLPWHPLPSSSHFVW